MRTEKQKMLAGELYRAADPELQADLAETRTWLIRYNRAESASERHGLLRERLGAVGARVDVRPPFFCDYGFNIRLGADVFLNYNCVILDVVEVVIGNATQIGPAVQIYAADHPRNLEQRKSGVEIGRRIQIGRDVWIGGGVIILPGVTVGDGAVIGAGSVVTRDVPPGVTVMGNPARQRSKRVGIPP